MAGAFWSELFLWMVVLGGIVGSFCACMRKLVVNDSAAYDLEFLWDSKFTLQELELDRNRAE